MSDNVTDQPVRGNAIAASVHEAPPRPLSAVLHVVDHIAAVWAPPSGNPVVSVGAAAEVNGTGPDRFQRIRADGQTLLAQVDSKGLPREARPRLFGGFSFFDAATLEPPWEGFSPAGFVLPAVQITMADDRTVVTGFGDAATDGHAEAVRDSIRDASRPSVREATAGNGPSMQGEGNSRTGDVEMGLEPDRATWVDRVRSIQATIGETSLEKAVLAAASRQPLDGPISLATILDRLETRYPDCYRFSFTGRHGGTPATDSATFFGASPETLVTQRGRRIETEALAGTVERGGTEQEDTAMKDRLQADETLATEHELVADRIAGQLERFGADVTVGDRGRRTLANVHHLQTPIQATVPSGTHVLDLVALLHPTPAVGGLPTGIAQETIKDVESTVRGWYGAPIGWFDETGDGSFAVGIRSAIADRNHVTLFAGNGIVAGSVPETEYEELAAKFAPMMEVLE